MDGYSVLIEVHGEPGGTPSAEDAIDALVDAVAKYAGSVGGGGDRWSARIFVEATDAPAAVDIGTHVILPKRRRLGCLFSR